MRPLAGRWERVSERGGPLAWHGFGRGGGHPAIAPAPARCTTGRVTAAPARAAPATTRRPLRNSGWPRRRRRPSRRWARGLPRRACRPEVPGLAGQVTDRWGPGRGMGGSRQWSRPACRQGWVPPLGRCRRWPSARATTDAPLVCPAANAGVIAPIALQSVGWPPPPAIAGCPGGRGGGHALPLPPGPGRVHRAVVGCPAICPASSRRTRPAGVSAA